jgi:D-alanyl-D-alanine carboxypeptidase/D-alanyl-D-alanine-endopeptidase (penicillin-binding protein 4)
MGTTAAGLAAELAADRKLGLPLRGVHLVDGSGLDHDNQATCAALLAVLDASTRPRLSSLIGDLAVAGETGTLAERYRGTPLVGTLRAKTGSIDNAGGMVGEIDLATPVRFALILNKPMNDTALFAAEDAIVEAIAPYAAG